VAHPCGSFLNVPSPEHGTSQIIRSKYSCRNWLLPKWEMWGYGTLGLPPASLSTGERGTSLTIEARH
jgi:hypothetical protein